MERDPCYKQHPSDHRCPALSLRRDGNPAGQLTRHGEQ
jgi:hypothetical protein